MKHLELIKRLEEGSGPDRELDAEIWCSFRDDAEVVPDVDFVGFVRVNWRSFHKAPNYTSSLDSCIALLREVLPGWVWRKDFDGNVLIMDGKKFGEANPPARVAIKHEDLCRALLIAILKAVGEGE